MTQVSLETFQQHTGSIFPIKEPVAVDLTLASVETRTPPGAGYECFALMFKGPAPPLPQATYTVSHQTLGDLSLFIVPVTQQGEQVEYESVFNRPAP